MPTNDERAALPLSRYKVPKSFRFLDKLPRDSAMGKIQRKVLRELPPGQE